MIGRPSAAEIARSPEAWERIARDWIVEVIERTPLADVDALPLGWMSREAPPLIAEILGQLTDPGSTRELRLPPAALERIAGLGEGRGPGATRRLPRELAALQSLVIDALDREGPRRDRGDFARAAARLAEVFGVLAVAAMDAVPSESGGQAPPDPHTGLPGPGVLRDRIRDLAGRAGGPFALVHVQIEGVERIAKGYGEEAAARMVEAVAGIVAGQLTPRDSAYREGAGEIVVVIEGSEGIDAAPLGVEIAEVVDRSQGGHGPRVDVVVGIASYPANGEGPEELLDAAEEAAWAARAAGDQVSVARPRIPDA